MDEDDVWTRRIEASLTEVRGWEERFRTEPAHIDRRSSLGADDACDPAFTVSSMAFFGLQSSVDHLAQVADILTTPDGAQVRPHALFTLTRTALLAAAQTVWLLCGSDQDQRLERTAIVYKDEWQMHLNYLNDYQRDPLIRATLDGAIVEGLHARIAKLTVQLAGVAGVCRLKPTRMLDDAAKWVSRDQTDGWQRRAFIHDWRMGSAAAHARLWPMEYRAGQVTVDRPDMMSVRWPATTFEEIATSLVPATLMVREGFRLWDEFSVW